MSDSHTPDKRKSFHTDDPFYYVNTSGLDLQNNEIYLFGKDEYTYGAADDVPEPGVEYTMANQFIKNIRTLQLHTDKPILIHLKTCGGLFEEGMAIYDSIVACPNHVTILNYTHARSMSSIIFLAADKRVMMPSSVFMYHEGTFDFGGTQKQLRTEFYQTEKQMNIMLDIYVDALKTSGTYKAKSASWIRNWVKKQMNDKEEVYLSATETVELGFADMVFGKKGYDWKNLKGY